MMRLVAVALLALTVTGCASDTFRDYYQYRESEQGQLDAMRHDVRQMKFDQIQREQRCTVQGICR